jgi:demethylmenaquinone methyltransferase / 2-methoxy-6-polyprenyl-1,4-benzoquinol methylase
MLARQRRDPVGFTRSLFSPLAPHYDRVQEVLSFGQNARWRRAMVDRVVATDPRTVLDVATGTAGVARQVRDRTSASVVGIDLTEEMLHRARERVDGRIGLVTGDADRLPFADESFDALTFTYLWRYVPEPPATMRELARVVRPGGVVAGMDFHVPPARLWRGAWWLYTRIGLPAAGVVAGDGWYEVGRFLGPSISRHARQWPVERQVAAWGAAGLVAVGWRLMSLGGGLVIWGSRRRG